MLITENNKQNISINVTFLCILQGNPYLELLVKNLNLQGVRVNVQESNFSYFFLPILLNLKSQILHLHTLHFFFLGKNLLHRWVKFIVFLLQLVVLKLLGIRIVWTVHEWSDRFGNGKNGIPKVWSIVLGRLFYAIVVHCNSTGEEIKKAITTEDHNKIFVVPHGNYLGCYENNINRVKARASLEIPINHQVFLLFGGIHRTKGFLEAIDAFKGLDNEQLTLLIAGFPAEAGLEDEIKLKIKNHKNILFVPKLIPDDEIQIYMNAADCVIIPYKVFTTSGVTILSMSFGKACIAPNVGFFKDVLDTNGAFLYEPNDENGLANMLSLATRSSGRLNEMGEHNLSLAKQWDWHLVARKTFEVYQHCVKAG